MEELRRQVFQLNRALGMITGSLSPLGAGVIPESYFRRLDAAVACPYDS